MSPRNFGVWLLGPIFFCFIGDRSILSGQDASTRAYLDRIKLIRKKGDAEAVQKLMADIDADWGAKRDAAYYYVILELCGAVGSVPALDPNRTNLVRKLATTAIDAPGDKPIYSEVRLLLFLQGDPDYIQRKIGGADWEKERLIRVHRWLTTWQHLRVSKSKLPAVVELPELNVEPPEGVKGVSKPGMSPDRIKDPVLRKQYEEAIAKNIEKARIYREKRDLDDLEARFVAPAKRYIINAYARPPFNIDEMERSLEKNGVDKETRAAMVKEVQRLIAEKTARDAEMAKALAAAKAPKPPEPFIPPPVGTSVNAKVLSTDPKLQVPVIFKMTQPQLGELLDFLGSKTGYQLTAGGNIPRERVAYCSIHSINVAAWSAMDQLNEAVTEKGHWVKEENGYKLVGDPKPPLKIQPATEEKPSPRPDGRKRPFISSPAFKILMFFGLLVATALLVYFHRRRIAKSAQPK